jgi:hypothetical protein
MRLAPYSPNGLIQNTDAESSWHKEIVSEHAFHPSTSVVLLDAALGYNMTPTPII